jgi:membrane-bound lytic murein transglycosylase D
MDFKKLALAGVGALLLSGTACNSERKTAQAPLPVPAPPAVATPQPDPPSPENEKPDPVVTPPPPEAVQAEPRTPKADSAEEIIAKAEREYQEGVARFHAGNRGAAQQSFDRAFNLLVQGPVNAKSNPRLQERFNRIADGVNRLEAALPAPGEEATTAQKSEPAPIDETNEVTPPVDPNIKAKAEAEIKATHSDLPLMLTDQVAGFITYFSGRGRPVLERGLARAGQYRDMIHQILREEGVPLDLIYLAQAESGFHPLALSRAGARGMWQFMAMRARGYGLARNYWVDERQDPEKSTRAAARHLKDLYNQFGDWYLAMAAYNSGPGTVQSAVKRTGYADFWELYRRNVLPRETRNYVPIILAVTIMAKNPSQYGLDSVEPDPPLLYDTVKIRYPVDLRLVAECVDAPLSTLEDLNPSLLRLSTPKDGEFELHLPAGTRDQFERAIAAIPENMRLWWRYHKMQPGETLELLSRIYRTTPQAILAANGLEDDDPAPGTNLIIPITPGKVVPGETGEMYSSRATRYRVRKGDTVISVAEDFGVPAERLRRWNHLRSNALRPGRILRIYLPVKASPSPARTIKASGAATAKDKAAPKQASAPKRVYHKVRKGETLTSIASAYNTTVSALKRDNPKVAANLHPGDVLLIHATR